MEGLVLSLMLAVSPVDGEVSKFENKSFTLLEAGTHKGKVRINHGVELVGTHKGKIRIKHDAKRVGTHKAKVRI